jgi:hypothetical protein
MMHIVAYLAMEAINPWIKQPKGLYKESVVRSLVLS